MATAILNHRLIPLSRVAEALGVSVFTVRRLINANSLPAVRIGSRVMVSEESVRLIQQQGANTK